MTISIPSWRFQNGWKLLLVVAVLLLSSLVFDVTIPAWFVVQTISGETQQIAQNNDTIPNTTTYPSNTTTATKLSVSETSTAGIVLPSVNISPNSSNSPRSICRVLISNRVGDFHYEILESVAMQYPIDWERHNVHCRQDDTLIVIDYFLDFNYKGYSNTTEAWGWLTYFKLHLQSRIVQRHAPLRSSNFTKHDKTPTDDRRWIQFGRVVDEQSNAAVDWIKYDVLIEANCGFVGRWEERLQQDSTRSYCVLHSASRKKIRELQLGPQICFLNPQHAPNCWFVPSDLPQFDKPSTSSTPSSILRVCMGWKADKNGEHRDTSLVAHALDQLQTKNVQIVVIGRKAKIPKQMLQSSSNLSQYIILESSHHAFYEYQRTISQCDALLPLIHPHGATAEYFLDTLLGGINKGKLSGMISQCIGNAIPAVIHSAAADIYRTLFTAPIFEYNETKNPASFINAFQQMMDHLNTQEYF